MDDSTLQLLQPITGAAEKLYQRFGHWLPMAKMVHDAQREAEYLRSQRNVDAARIGFMGFSLSAKAAVYIAAFAPEIAATVAIDPHIAINGGTNWFAPWYLDWLRPFPDIPTPQHTVFAPRTNASSRSVAATTMSTHVTVAERRQTEAPLRSTVGN